MGEKFLKYLRILILIYYILARGTFDKTTRQKINNTQFSNKYCFFVNQSPLYTHMELIICSISNDH